MEGTVQPASSPPPRSLLAQRPRVQPHSQTFQEASPGPRASPPHPGCPCPAPGTKGTRPRDTLQQKKPR